MLYYKLVNELPKFNIGDKFYRNEKGNLISCDNHKVAYSSEEIKNFPSILSRWFELVEGPDGHSVLLKHSDLCEVVGNSHENPELLERKK